MIRPIPLQGRAFLAANSVMLLAFVGATVVQWNDPDPVRWMLMYGSAAAVCALDLFGALPWKLAAAVGGVALIWAAIWAPGVLMTTPIEQLFTTYRMMSPEIEEARELLGLLLVAGWMAALAAARKRRVASGG
jgi:hypothetical protein